MKIKKLSKEFEQGGNKLRVLDNLSFEIKEKEILVLLAPSGAGKTTLLNILSGLDKRFSGTIETQHKKMDVGYMFQTAQLLDWRTVFENICLGLEIQNKQVNEKEIDRLLNKYGLKRFKQNYPNTLSGGMKQKVAFIRTIITRPDILLLDEPFSSLDYPAKLSFETELREFVDNNKIKTVLVTHDIDEAISIGDRILVLTKRPAKIKSEIIIKILEKNPVLRRESVEFSKYFQKIWEELKYEINDEKTK